MPQQDTTTGTSLGTPLNSPSSLNYTPTNGVASTPAPAAVSAPATATVTPTPSQTQSTDVTTLGQPTLSSSQLPQSPAYTPPAAPDLSTILANGSAPTASQGEYDDITSQIGKLTNSLGGQSADESALENQYNVAGLTSTSNDLTSNISQIQQQRDNLTQNLADQVGHYGTSGALNLEKQSLDGELSAKQSAYASTLATISGQLSTAQSLIKTAISNKYDPINNQITALKSQADLVSQTLNREQSKQLAAMNAQLDDRTAQIATNKAIASSMLEKIATAAANSANPAPSYIVTQAQNAALGDNPASALAIISPYLNDPLAAQKEIADIQQSKAATASSYADVALKTAQATALGSSPTDTSSQTPEASATAATPTATGAPRYTGSDPTSINAQAILDGLNAPPTFKGNTPANAHLMATLNTLSIQQTGHGYDQQAAQTAYKFRQSTFAPYVAKMPTAISTISSLAQLAAQANISNISQLNDAINSGKAAGWFPSADAQSAAKQLQSKYAQSSDDLGLILGTGTGTDAKNALASAIFDPNGGLKSTTDLANSVATTIQNKTADYATQAGIQNPTVYAHNLVQSAFTRGQQPDTDFSNGGGQTVTSNGGQYIVGQVYNDGTANWTVDAQGNWTKQ